MTQRGDTWDDRKPHGWCSDFGHCRHCKCGEDEHFRCGVCRWPTLAEASDSDSEREAAIAAGRAFVNALNRFIGSRETDGIAAERGLTIVEHRENALDAITMLERFGDGR